MTVGEAFRPDVPNAARVYDYFLGGKNNFPADREAAEHLIAMMPDGALRATAVHNRRFLVSAVGHLAGDLGVRQFLDIGAGLPTAGNVHEAAQSVAPESRVVYVDNDPVVVTHGRALLHGNDRAAVISHDARDPGGILADGSLRSLLDFDAPIAVLLGAVLEFISDSDDPYGIVRSLINAVPVGSYLVLSHFTADGSPAAESVSRACHKFTSNTHQSRTRAQVARFFAGLDLIGPGELVRTDQWRPAQWRPGQVVPGPGRAVPGAGSAGSLLWCGVARKSRPGPPTALPGPEAQAPRERLSGRGHPPPPAGPDPRLRPDVPNVARMYDYMLGGKDNYPADREAARQTFAVATEAVVRGSTLQNRRFLGRAVRYLARDLGVRQFLDIGTGLPTMNNVHEVAHATAPEARIVYVDNDPVVIAHARDMLNGVPNATIIHGDLRDPAGILADPLLRSVLDFEAPIAVLLVAVLHFITDRQDPRGIVSTLMDAVPPGSYLVVSHVSADQYTRAADAASAYDDASARLHFRTRAEIEAMLAGFSLVDPGELVWTPHWHPDEQTPPLDSPGGATIWCAVARK